MTLKGPSCLTLVIFVFTWVNLLGNDLGRPFLPYAGDICIYLGEAVKK